MAEELNLIFHACTQGRTDVVQGAIDNIRSGSASPQINDSIAQLISTGRAEDGQTPLHVASTNGHADVIRCLLNAGASLTVRGTYGSVLGKRPYDVCSTEAAKQAFHIYLFEAIAMNNLDLIKELLQGGVSAVITDGSSRGDTPLHWACSSSDVSVVSNLIQAGADYNATNALGFTCLHAACKFNRYDVILLLLQQGVDTTAVDHDNNTAQMLIDTKDSHNKDEAKKCLELFESPPALEPLSGTDGQVVGGHALDNVNGNGSASSVNSNAENSQVEGSVNGSNYGLEDTTDLQESFDNEDDEVLEDAEDARDGVTVAAMDPILVLWPPPQHMVRRSPHPFILSNDSIITLTAPSSELESVSYLVDVFNNFQFQVEVAAPHLGSIMKLGIDPNICPKAGSYELIIDPAQAQIIAADSEGLRYAVHVFVQLMQLHSDLTLVNESGVGMMKLPSVSISDYPDVSLRSVSWSYRSIATHKSRVMEEMISLWSRLRINTLLLIVDNDIDSSEMIDDDYSIVGGNTKDDDNEDSSPRGNTDDDSLSDAQRIYSGLQSLYESCKRHLIKAVPTLVFTSLKQRVPKVPVRRMKQRTSVIVMNFDYEQHEIAEELITAMKKKEKEMKKKHEGSRSNNGSAESVSSAVTSSSALEGEGVPTDGSTEHIVTKIDVENALKQRVADIMATVKEMGYETVIIVCNEWVKRVVNPIEITFRFGLQGVERPSSCVFPVRHFIKPIINTKDFIQSVYITTHRARECGSSICTFPAFVDNDVTMPLLLIKYYCFVFSGFVWNHSSVVDMLGDPLDAEATILREVAYLMMFPHQPDASLDVYNAILTLLTGQLFSMEKDVKGDGAASVSAGPINVASPPRHSADRASLETEATLIKERETLGRVESILYALVTSRENISEFIPISQQDAAIVVKYYRRLLHLSKWKMGDIALHNTSVNGTSSTNGTNSGSSSGSDINEFFSVVNLIHGLAKSIIYSYAGKEKMFRVLDGDKSGNKNNNNNNGLNVQNPDSATPSPNLSYAILFSWVAPGTNSDTANFLLESLEYLSSVWRERYDVVWFFEKHFYSNLSRKRIVYVTSTSSMGSISSSPEGRTGGGVSEQSAVKTTIKPVIIPDPHMKYNGQVSLTSNMHVRRNFFRREREGVPTTAIFNAGIMSRLPSPKVVENTFHRLFGGNATE